jgi:hypothetical protein
MRVIIKDINGKPIYEKQKFKFQFQRNIIEPAIELIGSFDWHDEELRYEIDIWDNPDYVCLSYVPGAMRNFELIEEQPKEEFTKEWLLKELSAVVANFEQAKTEIYRKYCFANNPYKKGDIITDPVVTIRIEEITFSKQGFLNGEPCCVYIGEVLTKKLEPRKDGAKASIYQSRIIK